MPIKTPFQLDERLERDSLFVTKLALCDVRLLNDSRWPWLVLVPRIGGTEEIHHLGEDDQIEILKEIRETALALEAMTGCLKINTGALGNIVRQLHIHIIARNEGDANWPGPVWGFSGKTPYHADAAQRLIQQFKQWFHA